MDRFSEYFDGSQALLSDDRPLCDECGEPSSELRRVPESPTPMRACDACYDRVVDAFLDAADALDNVCTCVQTDVDLFDARGCAAHGRAA